MPMVEIDEVELQQSKKLRGTVEKMLKDPKARRKFLEAAKVIEPETPIPELDASSEVDNKIAALEKQIADDKKAREAADAKRDEDAKIARIVADQSKVEQELRRDGWTEEGIKGVKELAEKNGILDLNIAVAAFEKAHPPQNPVSSVGRSGGWDFTASPAEGDPNADFVKKLLESKGENEPLLNRRAQEALAEVRGQRR